MATVLFIGLLLLSYLVLLRSAEEGDRRNSSRCNHFRCGPFLDFKFPFFSTEMEPYCGLYKLNCSGNPPTIQLEDGGTWFNVDSISVGNTVMITDPKLQQDINSKTCDGLKNWTRDDSPWLKLKGVSFNASKCNRSLPNNPSTSNGFNKQACNDYDIYYSANNSRSNLPQCSTIRLPASRIEARQPNNLYSYINATFIVEINLPGECYRCHFGGRQCTTNSHGEFQCVRPGNSNLALKIGLESAGVLTALGGMVLVGICIVIYRRKLAISSREDKICEAFLTPKRYSYGQVKKMTNSFSDMVGRGGFGTVYKGSLPDGRPVAVKVLKESKSDGEDFINEVASMSKTSHVNVVNLLGFCYQNTKRCIIYEYVSNGSLYDFVLNQDLINIAYKAFYEIAAGIAQGLEYLHHGCKIVHFDIKPQNILLDEDLCPKISDFGLAKLMKKKESNMSMVDARGTIGYIAPEVFSRNYGRASHKSDVYSYGMLVLEMLGRRKNDYKAEAIASNTGSTMYFPDWIYKDLERRGNANTTIDDSMGEEQEIVRKMILVSLWCVQINPADRPSMGKVVEMLEGSLEALQIPPKPFLGLPTRSSAQESSNPTQTDWDEGDITSLEILSP